MGFTSAVGVGNYKFGFATNTSAIATPYNGQVVLFTDSNQLARYDGSQWVGLDESKDRNVVINGAMQVAQRGTSTASITTDGYYTADRWSLIINTLGTWTESVENDAPTGSGFRKSLKVLCTTADASPAAADYFQIRQVVEGQNLQQFLKGTASAKQFTVSFWVKSNVTGTYILNLVDVDNTRSVSASYTVSASATWEKKTVTIPADTTGAFDNDNGGSLRVSFLLAMGSDYTSGTLNTTWESTNNANRAVGQTNLAAATNNYWQITGVQLEAGAVATPFEFEDYGVTFAKCERYFQRNTTLIEVQNGSGANRSYVDWQFRTAMRATPTVTNSGAIDSTATTIDRYYGYRNSGNAAQIAAGATADSEL